MYTIKIDYRTGNSFGCHDEEGKIEGEFSLDIAKENLKRIKAHYNLYQIRNNYYSIGLSDKGEKSLKEAQTEPWFYSGDGTYGSWEYELYLLENDGSSKSHSTFWIGYFERLISARIISKIPEDDGMNFTP